MKNVLHIPFFVSIFSVFYASHSMSATCEFSITNEWNSGFNGSITITNPHDVDINGWLVTLQFANDSTLSSVWDAVNSGNNPYQIANASYNSHIAPNASVSFGFNAQKATLGEPAAIPELGGLCQAVTANLPPVAVATASALQGDVPFTVTFDASSSTDPDGDGLSFLWQLAENEQSTEQTVTFTYEQAGEFNVSLVVNDGALDSSPTELTIIANNPDIDPAIAYTLDSTRSSLHFVSTKKLHIIESHGFSGLTGQISTDGNAEVRIPLDTIESGIDIRNQRMREHLFETATYSEAIISIDLDTDVFINLTAGQSTTQDYTFTLDLHGMPMPITTQVRITRLSETSLLVQNTLPIMIAAADFGLTNGIETLRTLAGLDVISFTVPVNFNLLFVAQ